MTYRLLFEDQSTAKKGKKKAETGISVEDQIRRMIDVKVGDFSAEIPESALQTVVDFIRELLKADMNTEDVINLIMTQVENDGSKNSQEIDTIKNVLKAIDQKYGADFINKIPTTFPFLAAAGADSYPLSELDPESLALMNYGKDRIGRGEVAIPLLYGIDKFAADDDRDEGKGTKSYDLVYQGKEADIKDYRNLVNGKLVDQGLLRIGGPSSQLVIKEGNELFKESSIDFVKYLRVEDFPGMADGADAIIKVFNNSLADISSKKLALMTRQDVKKELDNAVTEIVELLDSAVQNVITAKYPGGFFTIDEEHVKIVPGSGFEFYSCKKADKRIVLSPVENRTFKKGLQKKIDQKIEEVTSFIAAKTGKPVDAGTIEDLGVDQELKKAEPSTEDQLISEALLRRLIRAL
jgi:hypothetical protein